MTRGLPVSPLPAPWRTTPPASTIFSLLAPSARASGATWRGCCCPSERNKTLTALANTEPVVGAQRKEAQSLQWFLSESGWDPAEVNERRLELLFEDPRPLRTRRAFW